VRGGWAFASAVVVTVVSAAALVIVGVVGRPVPQVVQPNPTPVYVPVDVAESDRNQAATIRMSTGVPVAILAAGASGVITQTPVSVGSEVVDGTIVMQVSGLPIFAHQSATVLYRDLSPGDKGPDVAELQRFLAAHVVPTVAQDGVYRRSTRLAVQELQRQMGVSPATGVASSTWFVRIDAPLIVGTRAIDPGTPAPGLGATILTSRAQVKEVVVQPERPVEAGEYVIVAAGVRIPVTYDGTSWTAPDPQPLLAGAAAAVAAPGDQAATGTSVTGVAAPANGSITLEGRLALAEPIRAVAVPPGALVPSASADTSCVWIEASTGPEQVAGVVVVAVSPSGAAFLADDGLAGKQVLLDPLAYVAGDGCP